MENKLLEKVISETKFEVENITAELKKPMDSNHFNYLTGLRLGKKNLLVDLEAIKFDLAHHFHGL